MATIRQRRNGTYELRVTHRTLAKPYYSTHDSEADAATYATKLVAALDRGDVPPELRRVEERVVRLSVALRDYLNLAPIAASDRPMVEWLQENLDVDIGGVTVRWVDDWIEEMKSRRLTPGSIRKRVESLARAIDWWNRKHSRDASNPLRTLPKGYSAYGDDETDAPRDEKRDRRLAPGEAERIEEVILGAKREDRQRPLDMPHRAEFLLLFRIIVNTGLRLREAYRLTVEQIRMDLRTIHVARSKTGRARDVPMTKEVYGWFLETQSSWPRDPAATIFPFWDGSTEGLRRTTAKLSSQFSRVFEYAGCDDLTEHDLRAEATCRWMLMKDERGQWLFRPEEVRRITGHKSVQIFEKYLALRGSDLAERLW